ncbi:MAG: ribose-phosphate pyrophosphokinase-like domain-containing protein, partial [Lachnospiraceae bacterium]|nr:ribose-phosphate pyrophosphokinase-like domain-containing protein [Lachnospiraceae bacterium]
MPRNDDTLMMRKPKGPLGIIALDSFRDRAQKVDEYLVKWRHRRGHHRLDEITRMTYERKTFLVDAEAPRFGSGEGKGVIQESIRGLDIFLLVDVTNYSITYKMYGQETHMS